MRAFVLLMEPAEYTQALKREVFDRLGVATAYLRRGSLAAADSAAQAEAWEARSFWGQARAVWRVLREFDLVVVNSYSAWLCVGLFLLNALFFRRPVGIDADDTYRVPKRWGVRLLKAGYLRVLFTRRWCFGISPGAGAHRELFRRGGMPEERIYSVPMCADQAPLARAMPPQRPAGRPLRFGYLGRLVPHKRVDLLLAAFARLEPGSAVLEVVGAGSEREALERSAPAGAAFLGPRFGQAKRAWLWSVDVLVLDSDYEPWGLVVNEALAAGVPCLVGSRVGCAQELAAASGAGWVIPAGDAAALAQAMRRAVQLPPAQLQAMGAAGARFMRERWSVEIYRERWADMARQVMAWKR